MLKSSGKQGITQRIFKNAASVQHHPSICEADKEKQTCKHQTLEPHEAGKKSIQPHKTSSEYPSAHYLKHAVAHNRIST
jgi:hypothetical protein